LPFNNTPGYQVILQLLHQNEMQPFAYQQEAWQQINAGESGLINAPTGCGKTFAVFLGVLIRFINQHPTTYTSARNNGLQLLWITPLRALAQDIARAMESVISELGIPWKVGVRNGDTANAERERQLKKMPEVLIITPESLHLLLARKNQTQPFLQLQTIAVDEWHELLGSKRGVQVELALSRLVAIGAINKGKPSIWGISATIGNLEEAKSVLMNPLGKAGVTVQAMLSKNIEVIPVIPDEMEKYPWAGHLGIRLVQKAVSIIRENNTTLIFINTRGMSETWYQALLDAAPDLAGVIALHHGSIEQELRTWVEQNLHTGRLKAVVCTASLDLGVDFRPVDTVIQVGSPKGVSRFLQRAGRSGHQPGATSRIYFLPTHSLELVEVAALRSAMESQYVESRDPLLLCFDVLIQYCCTLAVGDGFKPSDIWPEIKQTYCFRDMQENEWNELLLFLTQGGKALQQYDDYKKVELTDGLYKIINRRIAMRHRMHIGTIVSDAMLKVQFVSGGYIGMIEEWFISRLQPGDVFTLAGRKLEFVLIREMTVLVRKSKSAKSIVPSWMGGRMSLTANLGYMLRLKMNEALKSNQPELQALRPLMELQQSLSLIPGEDELLIEQITSKDGYHLFVYPFEGRMVHEAMAAILAWRISRIQAITFSIAMNDYGFELLSDQPIPLNEKNCRNLFTDKNLLEDIRQSVNATEMARRRFRDIAVIGGLIFQGMPGEKVKARHLQSSASLLFNVFSEYEPENLLLRQANNEVLEQQMEEVRLRLALQRICKGHIRLRYPKKFTPFCFPIVVDGLNRNNLSSERLEDRIRKMQRMLENV